MSKSNRRKFSEMRQGMTVYCVHAFGPGLGKSWIKRHTLAGKPRRAKRVSGYVVSVVPPEGSRYWPKDPLDIYHFHMTDRNVREPGEKDRKPYNFHGAFRTLKAAQRHANRIDSGCFTAKEREFFEREERRERLNYFD